jgi:SAM-dependent methyltransferase
MIQTAQKLNQYPRKCRYLHYSGENLRILPEEGFTFVYSNMALQHVPPEHSRLYIAEFGRITKRGGLVVFHLPSRRRQEEGLAPAACAASIVARPPAGPLPARTQVVIKVSVENASSLPWHYEARRTILLGNHWLTAAGEMLRRDDGRIALPNDLAPAQRVDLALMINTPPEPGSYLLEFDLVQEGVAWFKQRGSTTLRIPAEILAPEDRGPAPTPAHEEAGKTSATPTSGPTPYFAGFRMHCTPRAEVIGLLQDNGLRLEFIQESDCAGPGFQSYFYFARKVS